MTRQPNHPRYRVALLIETAREVGRGLLRGILQYERGHGPWGLHIMPGDLEQDLPRMAAWRGSGIIARVVSEAATRAVVASGLPVVVITPSDAQQTPGHPLARFPSVRVDGRAVAELAARHLMDRGYRHFGFVGDPGGADWSRWRGRAFAALLARHGHSCHRYPTPPARWRDWGLESRLLADWLARLPHPVAIMAALDLRGRQVIESCIDAGLRVPEDVAVIGVDNDQLMCDLCDPSLSSIALHTEQGGYRAAELLHRMMRSGRLPARPIHALVKPAHIVPRRSSQSAVATDPRVTTARRFIQDHADESIQVSDVAAHAGLARRTLELYFRRDTGRTVLAELHSVRMERVRALLSGSRSSIEKIASDCGFTCGNYLAKVFRREMGMSPLAYRLRNASHEP